jgi:pyruvate dehydrogenase E1 component beta subunit
VKKINMLDSINEALHEEMARDSRVFILAEDVGQYGGVWFASKGIYEQYGSMRAMDTPISEAGFTGLCVGAAMAGLRPVTEIMYMDFITACMDQLVNQAAKADLMSGWQMSVPLVVRTQYGEGTREAGQHSQSLEGWLCQTPGSR